MGCWSDVVWLVYASPKGVRVEAPRVYHPPRGSGGRPSLRMLRPHEMRAGERLTGIIRGVSRRTAIARAKAGRAGAAA